MKPTEPPEEGLTVTEERLLALLLLVRRSQQPLSASFASVVMRRVRWQLVARNVIGAMASVAALFGDVAATLVPALQRRRPGR